MQGIESFLNQVATGQIEPYFFVSHASADNAQIRPVIEVLLAHDIPLWFDRPRDAGLDPDAFVGSLSANERWTSQLNEALARAQGLIWFPSAKYSSSDECKRELACADMLQGIMPQFEVAGICVSGETFSELGVREQTRQATRAFVNAADEQFELDEEYRPELEELADILKAKLAAHIQGREKMVDQAKVFDGEQASQAAAHIDRVRDYTVPFRVDRTNQRQRTREIHDDYLAGDTPKRPIIICHGEDEDVSRQFVSTTLAERLLGETGRVFAWSEQTAQPIRPTWPSCAPTDTDLFARRFRDSLFEKFLGAGNDTGRRSMTEALAESFANDRCTRIVASRLDLGRKEKGFSKLQNVLDHVQAWAHFWEAFPFELADQDDVLTVIPVLEIIYDEKADKGGLFRRASASIQFERYAEDTNKIAEFNRSFANIEIQFLNRFDKITPGWVEEWIDDDGKLFAHLNDHKKEALRDLLESEFKGRDDLPMKAWSDKAAPVLEQWRIGIEGK